MPDYAEQAMKAGWFQEGAKWKHEDRPGKIYYNAKQIWDEVLPERLKRPLSADARGITKSEPKPETLRPLDAHTAAALEAEYKAKVAEALAEQAYQDRQKAMSAVPNTDEDAKRAGLIGGAGKWEEAAPEPYAPVTVQEQMEAQKPIPPKRQTLKGFKRGRDGVLVPKED